MNTGSARPGGFGTGDEDGPARVDAALRQTVALLELVRQEEALLGWLNDCVTQLRAIQRARAHLLEVTDVELAEAQDLAAAHVDDPHRSSASSREAGL
ncbi:hypothetical protein [Microlunatus antarcticus]|uniref:Uncharacterized protein n=1 Tax=Microlunatus antarcticus TaxID=53388 RepID=A0A7W5JUF0_9ACTN|nr:hypothetical protein [Microlunatus antarcticus]MBB3326473.1 hypothetical protein [Microlunatus antarcticus]